MRVLRKVGLVVRRGPYQGRSGRDQLDVALAAATLGIELALFFTADGLLQLLPPSEQSSWSLPGGVKGWKSLPGLTRVCAWSTPQALERISDKRSFLSLEVHPASEQQVQDALRLCDRVLLL